MTYLRAALLGGLLLALCGLNQAAAPPAWRGKPAPKGPFPTGNWKIRLPNLKLGGTRVLWLVQLEKKAGKWTGRLVAAGPGWRGGPLEKVSLTKGELRFTISAPDISLPIRVRVRKEATRLFGEVDRRNAALLVELEKTALTSLDPLDLAREKLNAMPNGFEAIQVVYRLLQASEARKLKPAEVRKWAERAIKSASLYGSRYQREVLLFVAEILSEEKGYENIGVQYARRAERGLDMTKESPKQKMVLDVLAAVLKKAGKAAQAKETEARIKKLDFRIKTKAFAGRKGKSNRVVLAELFTNSQIGPSVASARAFSALGKTFKPTEVVWLCYHFGLALPDPLTCSVSEARAMFYGEGQVTGVPTLLLNGKSVAPGGGDVSRAQDKYDDYLKAIIPLLEQPAKAQLQVSAVRTGKKIRIVARVDKLAQAGPDVRLRLVLVEDRVNYKGKSGETVHECVVRFMPGGPAGVALKTKKPVEKTYTIDIENVREKLNAYLDKVAAVRPFPDKKRPLVLRKLRVVAFVQNNKANDRGVKEVLQAAQAEVKEKE